MPEGDTIHSAARRVGAALVGHEIEEIATPQRRHRAWTAGPSASPGARSRAVDAHGKHLFIRFDGELTLHSHLRMTGKWGVYRRGERWRRCPRRAWLVIRTAEHEVVEFDGPVLELMTESRTRFDQRLGDARPRRAGRRVRRGSVPGPAAPRRLHRGIGDALLDQRTLAGIGNVWKSEGCFLAGLDPWRRTGRGLRRGGAGVVRGIRPLMRLSVERGGRIVTYEPSRGDRGMPVGLRADRPALPALRHPDPRTRPGRRQPHDLLVPLRARADSRRAQGRRPRGSRQHHRELRRRARARGGHDRVRRAAHGRRPPRAGPRRRGRHQPGAAHSRRGTRPLRRRRLRRRRARRRPQAAGLRAGGGRRPGRARPDRALAGIDHVHREPGSPGRACSRAAQGLVGAPGEAQLGALSPSQFPPTRWPG